MIFTEVWLPGAYVINTEKQEDERGFLREHSVNESLPHKA